MVVLEVHKKNISIKYKNTLLSKAVFLKFLTRLFNLFLPMIIAYKTGGLWSSHIQFYDEPKINFLGDYILVAAADNSNPIICSSFPFYRKHMKELDMCSLIKVRETDSDLDSRNENVNFILTLNLLGKELSSLNLILPIRIEVNKECNVVMQSLIILQHHFTHPTTFLKVIGNLRLAQSSAIHCSKNSQQKIYDTPLIDNWDISSGYALDNIIGSYLQRNITTHLADTYSFSNNERKDKFDLELLVRYPDVRIYYIPGIWRIAKEVWIQYLAIFFIVRYFTNYIIDYIYDRRLILFYEDSPLIKKL